MALIIGTDAYDTLDNVKIYWANRGGVEWSEIEDADGEIFIRKATDYIDRKWDFIGDKATSSQRLKWPRKFAEVDGYLLDSDIIPFQIQEATALMAEQFRIGTFNADGIVTDDTASITETKVDVITVKYDTTRRLQGGDVMSHVIELLRPLISGQGRLLRAVTSAENSRAGIGKSSSVISVSLLLPFRTRPDSLS